MTIDLDDKISRFFTLREVTRSSRAARLGIPNLPDERQLANLRSTSMMLDSVRDVFGPIYVTSGFRCPELNAQTPGSSTTSAHPDGRALDFVPLKPGVTLRDVAHWLALAPLAFDQVIYEYGSWIHLGIARPGREPRQQVLMRFADTPGYLAIDWNDPQVR